MILNITNLFSFSVTSLKNKSLYNDLLISGEKATEAVTETKSQPMPRESEINSLEPTMSNLETQMKTKPVTKTQKSKPNKMKSSVKGSLGESSSNRSMRISQRKISSDPENSKIQGDRPTYQQVKIKEEMLENSL